MVKKILLVFIILISLCTFVNANSVTPFSLNADTKNDANQSLKDDLIGTSVNMIYKDGYIFAIQNSENTEKINYYDSNYKLKKSTILENNLIIEGVTCQDYIYLLSNNVEDGNSNFKILKLDENLEIVKELSLVGEDLEKIRYFEYFDFSKYGMPFMSAVDNKISIMAFDEKNEQEIIIQVDLDLTTHEVVLFDDENLKTYFINFYNVGNFVGEMLQKTGIRRNYVSSDSNDNYIVYSSFNINDDTTETSNNENEPDPYTLTYLTLTDKNNQIIFDKSYDAQKEYKAIINVKLIDNYIVAIGLKSEGSTEYKRQIIIFDLKGNVVQTIDNNAIYTDLITTNNGFAVSRNDKNEDSTYVNYVEFYKTSTLLQSGTVADKANFNSTYIVVLVVAMVMLLSVVIIKFVKK